MEKMQSTMGIRTVRRIAVVPGSKLEDPTVIDVAKEVVKEGMGLSVRKVRQSV